MADLQDKIIELMDLFDDEQVTTADKIDRPQQALEKQAIDDFMKRNPMAGGGMLVQPSADGSRPGYAKDFAKEEAFTPSQKKKIIEAFPETKFNFDKFKYGVKKYLTGDQNKTNKDYTKVLRFVKKGFTKDMGEGLSTHGNPYKDRGKRLSLKDQEKIKSLFKLPPGEEWDFKTHKYGIKQAGRENLLVRMARSVKDKKPWKVAADFGTPEGWMILQMNRVFENEKKSKVKKNNLTYQPVYKKINGVQRIIGFKDNTQAGGGNYYYGLKNHAKKNATNFLNHGDFKLNQKLVDISKRSFNEPNEVITGLLKEKGFKGQVNLNQLINYLSGTEANSAENIKNAIVRHHNSGVAFGSATNDLSLTTQTVNAKIREAEKRIRAGNILSEDVQLLKNNNIFVRGKDGKLYGGGSKSPIGQFKQIEKSVETALKEGVNFKGKKFSDVELVKSLATFSTNPKCAVTFGKKKKDGGRIEYQTGTVSLSECAKDGAKNFQDGKFKTADQVQDAAKLLSGGRRVLSGLMKYGIIPELAYVGLEATGRSILGEKPLNAIKKSIDTFTFGLTDFTSGIEAEKFGKFGDLKLDVDKYRNSLAKVNSIQQDIANLETLNTGSQFGYEGDQTEAIQMKKAQLEAAKKELQQNMISPDKVSFIDRMSDNIADAQMAKSGFAKASLKDQMEGVPGVADYMDTETARVFPKQPSQAELNLNLLPNFREALKTDQAKIDRTIMNAPDDVLKDISPEALELKRGLQEAYKMENLKDTFGAEQIYGTQGSFFGEPLAKGGRAGFKSGALRKGVLSLIDEGIKKTPKDTTSALDKLIKKTLDEDLFDKKDRIIDQINISEAKKRKNYPYNQKVFEEPKNLDFYDAITKSNFRTKTGPYYDRIRKNKAGGGLLKQAGDRSGPPPESGPNPQGLQGLLNRGKKI